MKKWLQTTVLFLMLVAMPGISWYYLKKGEQYQLALRAELKDYGKLPYFLLPALLQRDTINSDDLQKKVVVVKTLDEKDLEPASGLKFALESLHELFHERDDVIFLLHSNIQDTTKLGAFLRQNKLDDPEQILITATNPALVQSYAFPKTGMAAIIDTSGTIRRYYNFSDGNEVRRITEQIAVLMHREKKAKPYLNREKEK